jgi:small-conductance mechanosensitive channel
MLDINKILDITPLLFVVSLSILTNFIGDTMSFKTQELFKNNMLLKHLIIVLLIYSTISVLYEELSPFERIKKTIIIWIMYLLLVKNTLRIVGILVILMFLQFILQDHIKYLKRNNKKENIDKLNKLNRLLEYLILILLVIGHVIYINKQKMQFKSNFNYYDLYLGKKYT